MTKQEKIREGIFDILFGTCMHITDNPDDKTAEVLRYLHSQGVVIKVDRELPKPILYGHFTMVDDERMATPREISEFTQQEMLEAGYVATEPLIDK